MSQKSDKELLQIEVDFSNYTLDALCAFLEEVEKRQLEILRAKDVKKRVYELELNKYRISKYNRPLVIWDKKYASNITLEQTKKYGITIKKVTRKKFAHLQLAECQLEVDHPVLCLLSQSEKLPFDGEDGLVGSTWFDLAIELLTITFYNLVQTKTISVVLYQHELTQFNFFKSSIESCDMKLMKLSESKDYLTSIILEVLQLTNSQELQYSGFTNIMEMIIHKIIGDEELYDPERKLVVNLLQLYSNELDVFQFSSNTNLLGFGNGLKIDIDPVKKKELQLQYKSLEAQLKLDWEASQCPALFQFILRNQIGKVLMKRRLID